MKSCCKVWIVLLLFFSSISAQFYFGRNKIQYHPFDWHVLTTPHFEIYYYSEEEELAAIGAFFAEESFSELEKKFNFTLIEKVPLIFYNSHLHFQQTNTIPYLIPEGVGGFFEFIKGRVVIPFDGSTYNFKRVIRHELVHVFMHNKIGQILRLHNVQNYRSPPLWFTEGLAEFWAAGWDSKAEMVIRDALINDYLVPLDRLDLYTSGFLLYKEGQSFLRFIDKIYGHDKILLILENVWRDDDFYHLFKVILQKDFKELLNEWQYFYKKDIYPLLEKEDTPAMVSIPLTKTGINAAPSFYQSENESGIVFITNRTGYSDIYWKNLSDDPDQSSDKIILRGERIPTLESLHLLQTRIDVNDSGILVFSSKSGPTDVLNFLDISSKKVINSFKHPALISIFSPAWSPDEKFVTFSALNWKGEQNIFLFDTEQNHLLQLTNDFYSDRDPSFSPDGNTIVFSSDRGEFGKDGFFNLFIYSMQNGEILSLTNGKFNDITPVCSKSNPNRMIFISDRTGAYNIWILDRSESLFSFSIADTSENKPKIKRKKNHYALYPLTKIITGVFDPHFAGKNEEDIIFTAFENFQFQIHKLDQYKESIKITHDSSFTAVPFQSQSKWIRQKYTAKKGVSTLPYRRKFTFDVAQTAIAYDPIFGFIGGAQVTVSDLLGNQYYHFLLFNTAETSSEFLGRFNIGITKVDLRRRLNLAYSVFHFAREYFTYSQGFFFERRYGGTFSLSYPLSVYSRFEATSSGWKSERNFFIGGGINEAVLVSNSVSYVVDNSIWGPVGPFDGMRLRLTVGQTIDFQRSNIYYSGILVDYRKYFRTSLKTLYALRFMTWINQGKDLIRFQIGGSWGIRGYNRFDISGRSFFLVNNEFRFPFAQHLALRFSTFDIGLAPIRGALFFDVGNAWSNSPKNLLGSFGVGLRGNLLGVIVLRLDIGKTTDFNSLSKGLFTQFFFGWDY